MKDIFDISQPQVMIDLETLGLSTNSVIVSIGCTRFTLNDGIIDTFAINIDPFDSKTYGLSIESATVEWWKGQPKEVSDMWKVDPWALEPALKKFLQWYGRRSVPTYGNSPSFDCSILRESLKVVGLDCPWNFRDETDYRTICKMVDIPYVKGKSPHSALNDAIAQTEHLLKILNS